MTFFTARNSVAALSTAILLICSQARAEQLVNNRALYPEGPLWIAGKLYYAEMYANQVTVWDGKENLVFWRPKQSLWSWFSQDCGPTSIAPYTKNSVVILCHLASALVEVSLETGNTLREFKTGDNGNALYHPNDSKADDEGGIYFSSAGDFHLKAPAIGTVYYLSAAGRVTPVATGIHYANGIEVYKGNLYVSEHLGRRVLVYPILRPGIVGKLKKTISLDSLTPTAEFSYPLAGPDGLEIDDNGNLYICEYGAGRVLVVNPQGELIKIIPAPIQYLTNMALSDNGKTMTLVGTDDNTDPLFPGIVKIESNHLKDR
jgi:gluconolactonase